MKLVSEVEVTFHVAGFGLQVERYRLLDINERACWHVNAGSHMQVAVLPVAFIDIPDARLRRIAAWHRLLARRGRAAKALGLRLWVAP